MNRTFAPCAMLVVASAALMISTPARADGVPAGTLIENTAQVSYTVGGITQTVPSNTVTVTVDEILDVTVASLDGGTVAINASGAVLAYMINNTGNGPEAYEITIDPAIAGDDFDPVTLASPDAFPIPGARLRYCITIQSNGSATANSISANDILPTNLTFQPGTIRSGSTCAATATVEDDDASDGSEADPVTASFIAGEVSVLVATLAAGETTAVTFEAVLN